VRTFLGWDDAKGGFMEAVLVAHCGRRAEGSYLYTLVLTAVATGWTECLPLLHHGQEAVVTALGRVRREPLPFRGVMQKPCIGQMHVAQPPVCLLVTGTDARVPVVAPRLAAGPQALHLGCNMLLPNTGYAKTPLCWLVRSSARSEVV